MKVLKEMRYNTKYFKENLPDWKRKKDPLLLKCFYRPLSFPVAALAASLGISANTVSYFSSIVAIVSCATFLINNSAFHIIGAVLVNVWLLLDCVDGNLARAVKSQPFGKFADGIGSYILVGLLCSSMSFAVYKNGGIIIGSGQGWFILIGALASEADTLMRLIYQKYKNTERELIDEGIIEKEKDVWTDKNSVSSLFVRIEMEFGIGGILPLAILLATIFHAIDIIVIYCFIYQGASCIVMSSYYIFKAIKKSKI